jgi:hypothetical protein
MTGLSPEQHARREGKVTASFLPYLMAGNIARISEEWMRLVGHPDYKEPDLSKVWPVYLGTHGEQLTLNWHEMKYGHALTRRGEVVNHPTLDYNCCTLDCWRQHDNTVLDVKWIGGHRKLDEACAFYTAQLIDQARCLGAENASLLVVHGGSEPVEYPVTWTPEYEAEMWARVDAFWACVLDLTPPHPMPEITAPVPATVEYDLNSNNYWVNAAGDWLVNRAAHKVFVDAEKELKSMVPSDAKRVFGGGITANRARNGALSIREEK